MRLVLSLVALLALALPAFAADVTFEGSYVTQYKNNRPNTLNGTATKTGENAYDAVFTTDWKGKIETYKGTIKGDLNKGEVKGDFFMMNGDKKGRHFTFTATADNGTLKGKTTEIKGNGENGTGDLLLKVVPAKPAK